jgi:Tol biopolymer transport system component
MIFLKKDRLNIKATVPLAFAACLLILPALYNNCSSPSSSSALATSNKMPLAPTLGRGQLVFDSNQGGNYEIYAVNKDGTGAAQLTDDGAYDSWWPRPSPARDKIAFYRNARGDHENYATAELWAINADGSNPTRLRAAQADNWALQGHVDWSPDGTKLAMVGGVSLAAQIYLTDTDGKNAVALTSGGGYNGDPSWSADGKTVIFDRCLAANCLDVNNGSSLDIYTVPAAGGAPAQLTNNNIADYDPYQSPDGAQIAWLELSNPSALNGLGAWGIYAMSVDGTSQRAIIDDGEINSKPAWSLDGAQIFFHRYTSSVGAFRLFSIRPDGTGLQSIDPFNRGNSEFPVN